MVCADGERDLRRLDGSVREDRHGEDGNDQRTDSDSSAEKNIF